MFVQFSPAEESNAARIASMILFLVVNQSCVLLKGVLYLELLFTQWTLQQFRKLFMRQFDVPPKHKFFFKPQFTFVTGELPLDVMQLNVAVQSFFAAEHLRALLAIDFPHFGLFSHVCFQSLIGGEQLSTVGTYDTFSIVLVHVHF